MDTYVIERPPLKPRAVVNGTVDKVMVERRAPHKGTPDVTTCRVHSDIFAALLADLPVDIFD